MRAGDRIKAVNGIDATKLDVEQVKCDFIRTHATKFGLCIARATVVHF